MKKQKWLVFSICVLLIAGTVFPAYVAGAASTFYVSKNAAGSNDGTSWKNAWTELDQINWDVISPGDTILIDGGADSMTYETPLVIGKSGTADNRIYIKLANESGRDGQAIFFGGREELIPECGSQPGDWTLPNELGRSDEGINFNNNSYITVDGVKWKGIVVHGCNNTGVRMSGSFNEIKCLEIYNNGSWVTSQFDTRGPHDGAPALPGVYLQGPDMTISYCIIYDNGEDSIQDYYQSQGGVNFTLFRSWLYNSRRHSTVNSSFNWSMHNDGIQFWDHTYVKENITISESIIGPGFMQTMAVGAPYKNVKISDSLFIGSINDESKQNINFYGSGSDWTVNHVTLVRPNGADDSNIDCGNTSGTMAITNSISSGARRAGYMPADIEFFNNYQYGHVWGTEIGPIVDPDFVNGALVEVGAAGWNEFDFTPQNTEVLDSAAGTYYTSVKKLLDTIPGSAPRPLPEPKPTPRPVPIVKESVDELLAFLEYGELEGLITGNGTLKSLKAKITNLPNNINAIINKLNALKNEIEAQSGKKLDAAYAALLLINVDTIIEVYKAGGPEFIWYSAPAFSVVKNIGTENTGIVTTEFDIVPLFNNIDGVIGYTDSSRTISGNGDLAVNIWFNVDGYIQAMDGGWPYTALAEVPYTAGNKYHIKMTADVPAKTFDVWVTPPGGEPILMADDYKFRSSAADTDDLGKLCLMSGSGVDQYKIINHVPGEAAMPEPTPTPEPSPTPEPTPTPPVSEEWFSAPAYRSVKFLGSDNTGIVTAEFDVVPLFNNIDGVIGYADTSTTINNVADLGPIIWFNVNGYIQAMDGQWPYSALADVPYVAGSTYHIRMVADVPANTFDVWVTPPDGEPIMIADDYHFRYSAPPTDDLGKICLMSQEGDAQYKIVNHTPPEVEKLPSLTAPALGYYTTLEPVVLTAVDGASIYYTTDNTIPSDKSTLYTGPLTITEPTAINAIAYLGNTFSDVATFQVKAAEPFGLPAAGTYGAAQEVTLGCVDPDAKIYYTTDGSEPSSESALYTSPINVTSTMVIKAVAIKNTLSSKVSTLKYVITSGSSMFLKADGKVLRNNYGAGDIVALRGTNAGGWLVQENWMNPTNAPDQKTAIETLTSRFGADGAWALLNAFADSWWQEEDFDNIKAMGMNVIRLPFTYFEMLDSDWNLKSDAFARMDWFVNECSERGLYVILDMHGAPGSQNGNHHSGDSSGAKLYNSELYMSRTVFLWQQIADRYKGNQYIAGYDLLNEPVGAVGEDQWDFYDRLYDAIRNIDSDHAIFIEATWDPADLPDPSTYGWENVVYEYHFYEWENPGSYEYQTSFINSKVEKINAANYNVPILIGEFCLFDNPLSWDYTLNLFNKQGWSWTGWSYKSVDCGNWAIYNSTRETTPKVNIYTDTYEQIMEKWSNVDTDARFFKNEMLYDMFKKHAEAVIEPSVNVALNKPGCQVLLRRYTSLVGNTLYRS